jgi:hypothetical protein
VQNTSTDHAGTLQVPVINRSIGQRNMILWQRAIRVFAAHGFSAVKNGKDKRA